MAYHADNLGPSGKDPRNGRDDGFRGGWWRVHPNYFCRRIVRPSERKRGTHALAGILNAGGLRCNRNGGFSRRYYPRTIDVVPYRIRNDTGISARAGTDARMLSIVPYLTGNPAAIDL